MGSAQSTLVEQTVDDGSKHGSLKHGLKGLHISSRKGRDQQQTVCVSSSDGPPQPGQHAVQRGEAGSGAADAGKSPGGRPLKAASFLQWAKRQSKQRKKSLQEFLVESAGGDEATGPAQEDVAAGDLAASPRPSLDTLGLQDVLAVLTAEKQQHQQQQQQEVRLPHLAPFQPHNGYVRGPPKPHCHEARVAAADGIQALRVTRDGEIESMLRLLCTVFEVETATVALLTGEAIYITGACGALQACICPDRWGFCGWSFINSHHELLVVEDMDADSRFCANFFVIDPAFHLKFYVAAPLISSNGHRLGTLCVMGQQARRFDAVKGQVLANLAEMLVRQLEVKWVTALQASGGCGGLLRATSCYSSCYLVLDLSCRPWRVLHMNEPARTATGVDWQASYAELANYAEGRHGGAAFEGTPLEAVFDLGGAQLAWSSPSTWEFTLSGLTLLQHNSSSSSSSSSPGPFTLVCRPATADGLDEQQPFFVGVPSWLALSDSNTWGRNLFVARLEPEQQHQQQQQPMAPFAGDSVEQLTRLEGGGGSPSKSGSNAAAVAAGVANVHLSSGSHASSSSNCNATITLPLPPQTGGTPTAAAAAAAPAAADFVWLPRGMGSSSSGSNAPSSPAASSQLNSSRSLGSWAMTPTSSSSGGSSSGGSSTALPHKLPPSSASVASGGSSRRSSNGSTAVVNGVGVLVRGLPVPGLVMGPLLGRGSYGRVYRGLLKGRPVAVKIIDDVSSLRLSPAGEPLEVSLTRDLRQPGLMATLTYTYADAAATPSFNSSRALRGGGGRTCWMVLEYCDKGVLADAVLRGWFRTSANPLTGAPHLRVIGLTALEVAAAMAHLHDQGVLHGDLCGGNVMLTRCSTAAHGFTAKVGDFGLVRTAPAPAAAGDGSSVLTPPHPVDQRLAHNAYGTITHQPPEVLLDGAEAFTAAADVYAWGVLLWEMLTGSRAWAGLAAPSVVVQVAVLKRSLAIPPALPPVLKTLLTGALNPDPLQRPSFKSIVEALTVFVQQSRAVDWENWQGAADAAHAAEAAAIKAADAAAAAAEGGSCGCPMADGKCVGGF